MQAILRASNCETVDFKHGGILAPTMSCIPSKWSKFYSLFESSSLKSFYECSS